MVHHTDLRLVFEAFAGREQEFNWLLTDFELNRYPPAMAPDIGRESARWFGGPELRGIVDTYEIQFIWGVLSGFRPSVVIDPAALALYPFADGNESFWMRGAGIQHLLADVEIVCWDASATLLLSRDDDLTRRFRTFFSEAIDLDEYNEGNEFQRGRAT